MGSEWREVFLTELYEIGSGLSKPAKYFGTGYPFLAFKDVFYNFFVPESLSQLVQSDEKERENCSVRRGDVFLTRTSETMNELGMSCVALKDYEHATFNGFTKRLRPKAGIDVVPEYVGYFFRSSKFRNEMLAFSTMSTRASLNNEMIGRLKLVLPPLSEQKAIAHVLGSLDDRIELNRRMNKTLESMAQALFKSWFVDFDPVLDNAIIAGKKIPETLSERAEMRRTILNQNQNAECGIMNDEFKKHSSLSIHNSSFHSLFPDEFTFSNELGWIPKGWEVVRFKQIIEKYIDNRGKTPPLSKNGGIPLVEVKHIPENSVSPDLNTVKYVSKDTYDSWFRSHLKPDDIVISTVGTIGRICMAPKGEVFVIAQNLLGLRFNEQNTSPFFMYYQMDSFRFRHGVDARLVITVQASIKRKDLETIDLLSPPIAIQKKFETYVKPLMDKQKDQQNKCLSNLRDTLLPKLLSGELRIPEAEKMVEELAL